MASRALTSLVGLSVILSYGVRQCVCDCNNVTVLSKLLDSMLSEYDREEPPTAKVQVQLSLDVRHASIIEHTSTLRLLADLHMNWQDSRITWNSSDWGCDWALGSPERLWTPDVTLANGAATTSGDQPLTAKLTSSGAVAWTKRLDVSLPITMNLQNWPNDVQTGEFKFASRGHDVDEIDLDLQQYMQAIKFESGAWELTSLDGDLGYIPSAGEDVKRRLVTYTLRMTRRAPSQLLAARVALTASLLLLGAAAMLPPTNRTPLAAAAALISTLWLCSAVWRLPGGSMAPSVVCLQGGVCAAAGAAAVATVIVLRVARLNTLPPSVVRSAVSTASRVLAFSPPPEGTGGDNGTWAGAARALDATLLAAIALALLVLLCVCL